MKEIGELFKEKRESIELKVSEVSKDLNITEAQLENLEEGNINAFKDIFFLKELIKKYAIYLNEDDEKIINEFNEYVFDYTSKIPVKELEEKIKEIQKEEKEGRKIISPYTQTEKISNKINPIFIFIGLVILVVAFTIVIITVVKSDIEKNHTMSYVVGGKNELTQQNYNG